MTKNQEQTSMGVYNYFVGSWLKEVYFKGPCANWLPFWCGQKEHQICGKLTGMSETHFKTAQGGEECVELLTSRFESFEVAFLGTFYLTLLVSGAKECLRIARFMVMWVFFRNTGLSIAPEPVRRPQGSGARASWPGEISLASVLHLANSSACAGLVIRSRPKTYNTCSHVRSRHVFDGRRCHAAQTSSLTVSKTPRRASAP